MNGQNEEAMNKILIIGADDIGLTVADILLKTGGGPAELEPIGFLDDHSLNHGRTLLGLRVLGSLEMLQSLPHAGVVLAISASYSRSKVFKRLRNNGEIIYSAVDPSVIVGREVSIGVGCVVAAGAVVAPGCTIGEGTVLDTGCLIGPRCQVGAYCSIGPGARLGFESQLGALVTVGMGATIIPYARIGDGATIASHTLAAQDIPIGLTVVAPMSKIFRA